MNHTIRSRSTLGMMLMALPFVSTAQTNYYAVYSPSNGEGYLVMVDVTTCVETNPLPVTLNGVQVDGCTGMAHDPMSGNVYVVAKEDSTFQLATIDIGTGLLSDPVHLSERFAGIVFDEAGTLYGITGDGSTTPGTLYTIDPGTGALTQVAQPGGGTDGEALAYNTDNGLLYRFGGDFVFQSVDPGDGTVVDLNLSGPTITDWSHALVYNGANFFFSAGADMYVVSVNGSLVHLCSLDALSPGYKGLVSAGLVDIREHAAPERPSIFPNPARDHVTISLGDAPLDRLLVRNAAGLWWLNYHCVALCAMNFPPRSGLPGCTTWRSSTGVRSAGRASRL